MILRKTRFLAAADAAAAGCVYPQVFQGPFFEILFLFFGCSINMYLSWYFLFESPFSKDAVYVSVVIFDTAAFLYD